jgi:Carboxypeptidase regulatory-like domain
LRALAGFTLLAMLSGFGLTVRAVAQTFSQPESIAIDQSALPNAPSAQVAGQVGALGSVSGTVTDVSGAAVAGARIALIRDGQAADDSAIPVTLSATDGSFSFMNLASGAFKLTVTAAGFAAGQMAGQVRSGETRQLPTIALTAATNTEVQVTATQEEIAEAQINQEEKQRVLGVFPNFYVSYDSHPEPLTPKQKFELAYKTLIDPVSFLLIGFSAGLEQADNSFSGYGQGSLGYAKRYAAGYGDALTGTILGNALLPAIFKQDPRYFYKGTGTVKSRVLYAIANSVICKGDNGHWQFDYTAIGGGLASAGISNFYYPHVNRDGAGLTFVNAGLGIADSALENLIQEFLIRRLTPRLPAAHP